MEGISKGLQLNAGLIKRRDMSNTLKDLQLTYHDSCDKARALVDEIAELKGERYTLECRLRWIDDRLEALYAQLDHYKQES